MTYRNQEAILALRAASGSSGKAVQEWCKTATDDALQEGLYAISERLEHRIYIQSEISARQHGILSSHLSEIQKPHWTVVPNFRATMIAAIASVLACIISVLAWLFPRSPDPTNTAPTLPPLAISAPNHSSTQSTAIQSTPSPAPAIQPKVQASKPIVAATALPQKPLPVSSSTPIPGSPSPVATPKP